MREVNRERHEALGLTRRIAEHEALVTGALLVGRVRRLVHALRDVGRLLAEGHEDGDLVGREAERGIDVTDRADRVADHVGVLDPGGRRDLARDDGHAGRDERLAGDPAHGVLLEDRIEDRVGDLIRDLVRVTRGHALAGEKTTLAAHRDDNLPMKILR